MKGGCLGRRDAMVVVGLCEWRSRGLCPGAVRLSSGRLVLSAIVVRAVVGLGLVVGWLC